MSKKLHICINGSRDFVRRMVASLERKHNNQEHEHRVVASGTLADIRSQVLEKRPEILVFSIGLKSTPNEIVWLKSMLSELRSRLQKRIYIIAAVLTPSKFVLASEFLFANDNSLEPSGLLDNYIVSPPPGIPSIPRLEEQLFDSIIRAAEAFNSKGENPLPCLWDDSWAPTMCSPKSREIWMRWLPRVARYVNESPLIVGPTGSGKTRLAAALHALSGREGPFISITPRDFSSNELVQAELFGAVAGAYTGAVEKWGLVKTADKGTLFIDELQSIDFDLQGKLITFIENKSYRRVGEAENHKADVRFIFASNRSLQSLVEEGKLRDDFAYRLERLQLILPPLNERQLDISAGIIFALGKVLRERKENNNDQEWQVLAGLSNDAYRALFSSPWPGNLRQLENSVARLIELSSIDDKTLIDESVTEQTLHTMLGHKELTSVDILRNARRRVEEEMKDNNTLSLKNYLEEIAEAARYVALEKAGGNIEKAALLLGDPPQSIELFIQSREKLQ